MKNPYKKSWQNESETMKAIGWDEGYKAGLAEQFNEIKISLPSDLVEFYEKKGYNACPACGGDRSAPPSTGCPPGSHYGTYSEMK